MAAKPPPPRRFTEPWIKMRTGLSRAHQVTTMKRLLGLPDVFAVIGRLHAFWSWWDEKSSHGRCDGAVTVDVDEIVHTQGFGAALVQVKWLGEDDKGLYIPESDKHNGSSAKERALGNQRQAKHRARNGNSDGPVTPQSRTSHGGNVTQNKNSSSNKHPPVTTGTARSAQPLARSTPVEEPPRPTPPPASPSAVPPASANGSDPGLAPIPESVRAAVRRSASAAPRTRTRPFRASAVDGEPSAEPEWWETPAGIQREGMSHGITPDESGDWPDFVARVFVAAGEGPWMHHAAANVLERVEHWRTVGVGASG